MHGMADLTRHPWNVGFEWRDHRGPFRVLEPELVAAFDRDGYFVVPDLLAPDAVARVVEQIDRFDAELEAVLAGADNARVFIAEAGAITFCTHLVARSPVLRALACDPRIVGMVGDLVGPDARLYWDQGVYKKPEKPRRFPWHQDNGYAFVEPQQYLTIWIALTDATPDNGCPHVAPGYHRLGTLAHHYVDPLGFECFDAPERSVCAPVSAGGALVFSSLTPHLTGPNTSGAVRKAYIIQYAPEGARRCEGDPRHGPPTARLACDAPERQFTVVRDGVPVV